MAQNNLTEWSKTELIKEITKLRKRKKYGILWEDKTEKVAELCKIKLPYLEEDTKKEIQGNTEKPINTLIEGDNYHALSVLNYTHKGKVDVIYIDPPYNTGNKDFVYNDRYIDSEDSYRHSKWLSFMYKRLMLCKNLLKRSGAIFISIDDNEFAQLKLLCDEIFGEKNYVGNLIWRKKQGGGQTDLHFVTEHEYILVYRKSKLFNWLDDVVEITKESFNKEDERGKYVTVKLAKWGNTARREDRPKMYFPITSPDKKKIYPIAPDGSEGRWRVGKDRMARIFKNELIHWEKRNNKWIGYEKVYFEEGKVKKIKERSILYDLATTTDGTNQLTKLFGKKDIFSNPKPIELIKYVVSRSSKKNALVLDFFAGSGTTGQAVLSLNTEDNGNRQFILCTDNQDNNGSGLKISTDICYPRIQKVIQNLEKEAKGKLVSNRPSGLKYFKTDFVDAEPTDKNKRMLVDKSTEMLCLKEDCFDEVKKGNEYKIFKNSKDKYLSIIYDDEGIEAFKQEAKKLNKKIVVFVFSLDESAREEEFEDVEDLVELKPIPAVILNVYKRIFK